ncbi:MAG: hypothetical protein ABW040_06745 [Microbacteriaceae bacterium]
MTAGAETATSRTTTSDGASDADRQLPWWHTPFRMFQTNLREVDATLDVETTLDAIEQHGANAWLVNGGGILSFYPTELDFQTVTPYLADRPSGDLLGDAVAAAHARGVRLLARMDFSKVTRETAVAHPEWCFVDPDGQPQVYQGLYSVCPSGDYYQRRTFEIIDEIVERYPVDGFFFNWFSFNESDYSYRYRGVCHCDACVVAFAAETRSAALPDGASLPDGPAHPEYDRWLAFSTRVLTELSRDLRDHVASRAPNAALILGRAADIMFHEANNAFGRELWPHATAEAVSALTTAVPGTPVLVNAVSFIDMPYRLASEQPEHFATYLVQAISRGANPSTYIMGVPGDIRYAMLEAAGEVTRFHRDNPDVYEGARATAAVALVRPERLRADAERHARATSEFRGLYNALQETHVPFDVLPLGQVVAARDTGELARFSTLVLADVDALTEDEIAALDAWVADGGTLIATGDSAIAADGSVQLASLPSTRRLASYRDVETLKNSYVAPADAGDNVAVRQGSAVVPVLGSFQFHEWTDDAEPVGRYLAQAPFGPPEKTFGHRATAHPGRASRRHGAGRGILVPWALGHSYRESSLTVVRDLLTEILAETPTRELVAVDIAEQAEVTLNRVGSRLAVHVVNLSGLRRRGFGPPVPLHGARIRVRGDRGVTAGTVTARARAAGVDLRAEEVDGELVLELPEIGLYEVVVIEGMFETDDA